MLQIECPKCSKQNCVKDGFVKQKQRYKCKECRYRHTVKHRKGTATPEIKRQALHLYLEGLGFRSIGRTLRFSNVAVLNWIKSFGEQIKNVKSTKIIEKIEMDEMHTYVRKKIINGSGLLLIDLKNSTSILL